MYEIELAKKAAKFYQKADTPTVRRLNAAFDRLAEDPFHHYNIKPLSGELEGSYRFSQSLRAMRTACKKFLNTTQDKDRSITRHGGQLRHWGSWVFNGALGELRGVFGVHIARIAALHGLDVEDELASILPAQDNE